MGRGKKHRHTDSRLLRDIARTRAKKVPPPPAPVSTVPNTFQHVYGADALANVGPFLFARWTIPAALSTAIVQGGGTPPPPVGGPLLIDTGATTTHISEKAAQALGLHPTRIVQSLGISGPGQNNLYFARVEIAIQNSATGKASHFVRELEAMGVPDIERNLYRGRECIGLLGRDVLRFTRFMYDGLAGSLNMVIDYATMEAAHPGSVFIGPLPSPPASSGVAAPVPAAAPASGPPPMAPDPAGGGKLPG